MDDTWNDVEIIILPDGERDLAVLREKLVSETSEIAEWPKWRRRRYLTKSQHWAFEYKLALIESIGRKLEGK